MQLLNQSRRDPSRRAQGGMGVPTRWVRLWSSRLDVSNCRSPLAKFGRRSQCTGVAFQNSALVLACCLAQAKK